MKNKKARKNKNYKERNKILIKENNIRFDNYTIQIIGARNRHKEVRRHMFVALIIKVRIVAHLMDLPCVPSTKKITSKRKMEQPPKKPTTTTTKCL